MTGLIISLIASFVFYAAFALWWRFAIRKAFERGEIFLCDLAGLHKRTHWPLRILYVSHLAVHAWIALGSGPAPSGWLHLFLILLASILLTYLVQLYFFYPWHQRFTGVTLERYLQDKLAYLRLTAALLAPFFIFQFLNSTLIDPPESAVDAVEVLVFTIGRLVVLSLLTIVFSVMFMLKMIPNSRIVEAEHLELIRRRLEQVGWEHVRLRWIDIPDFNNAFVVGIRWFGFSNQTMFIGRSLGDLLTRDEFDAVICHELGHMANGHLLKRVSYAILLIVGLVLSVVSSLFLSMVLTLVFSHDPSTSAVVFGVSLLVTLAASYILILSWLFRNYRQQEHEADAFAVIKLGIRLEDMERALRKVARKFDDKKKGKSWNPFSTHPELETRIANVKNKIALGVAYDWNQSVLSRLLEVTFRAASPRTLAFGFSVFILTGLLTYTNVEQNRHYLALVETADYARLERFRWHATHVNARQYLLFGTTPLEVAASKGDLQMAKYLVKKGGDPSVSSGFTSAIDKAFARSDWELADYLLTHVSETWLRANSGRLFFRAAKEESGRALETLLTHRLQRFLDPQATDELLARISAQRSAIKDEALVRAGLLPSAPDRRPASAIHQK